MTRRTVATPTRNRPRERGAVLVEAALVLPLAALLLFGIIEFGLLFRDELTVSSAVKAGARVATALPKDSQFASSAQARVAAEIDSLPQTKGGTDADVIVVYKADPDNDGRPTGMASDSEIPTCAGNAATPCQVWTRNSAGNWTGPTGTYDADQQDACPPSTDPAVPDTRDLIGVYARVTYTTLTPLLGQFLGTKQDVSDRAVMRLEPTDSSQPCLPAEAP